MIDGSSLPRNLTSRLRVTGNHNSMHLPKNKMMNNVPINTGPPSKKPDVAANNSMRFREVEIFKLNLSAINNIKLSRGPAPRFGEIYVAIP